MPQFDGYSFFNLSYWFIIYFFIFFCLLLQHISPTLLTLILYRNQYLTVYLHSNIKYFKSYYSKIQFSASSEYSIQDFQSYQKKIYFNEFNNLFFSTK